jgi:hypothetical protein
VSFVSITLSVAFERVFIVVYFVIDSVRKLLDTPSYACEIAGSHGGENSSRDFLGCDAV